MQHLKLFSAVFVLLLAPVYAEDTDEAGHRSLPRAALGEGLPSQATDALIADAKAQNMDLHSVMVVQDGKIVYERWFGPNAPAKRHVMWSVSKTYTSMAVGFAIAEGKFTVEDKVVSFFPDDVPEEISPNLAKMRVKDLLTMSTGQAGDPTGRISGRLSDWEKAFFAEPVPHEPGTRFVYNSMATYMLSSIVQKTTGEKIVDYLEPRLFEPLGIAGAVWANNGEGVNIGGWGLFVKTEDMAKLGQFLLQKGRWKDKQLLPEAWIEEAVTPHVLQNPNIDPATAENDWVQGYGYQMWRCRHGGFRADGKDGQFIIVLPKENAVVAMTANLGNMQAELNLVWKHLLPELRAAKKIEK